MQSHIIFSVQTIAEPQLAQQCDTSLQHKPVIILINADFETYNTLPALRRGITGKSKRLYIKSTGFSSQSRVLYNYGNTSTITNSTIAGTSGTSTIGMMASSSQRANHNAINQVLASHAVHCLSATCSPWCVKHFKVCRL